MLKAFRQLTLILVLTTSAIFMVGCGRQEFETSSVLVVLTREATLLQRDFTPDDFPEVNIEYVEDLTAYSWKIFIQVINGEIPAEETLVNIDTFRRMLLLRLESSGRRNVLRAVDSLGSNAHVHIAEANYYLDIGWGN